MDWFGPTDFLTMGKNEIDHDAADSPESQLIGGPIQEKREKTAKSSPIGYVTPDDPPFLIMHGDKDNLVPLAQSEGLHEALRKAGVDSTLQVLPNQRHGFRGVDVQTPVEEFFQKHLKASKYPPDLPSGNLRRCRYLKGVFLRTIPPITDRTAPPWS